MSIEDTKNGAPPLLAILQALKPNVIYTMGNRAEIASAATAYSQRVVTRFRWGASGRLLEAQLDIAEPTAVILSAENGELRMSMKPPTSSEKRLSLAVVMTVVRVLAGAKFHQVDLPEKLLEQLRRELKAPKEREERARVVFSESTPGQRFEIDYDNGRRDNLWRSEGPIAGMEWLVWQSREPERVAEALLAWVEKSGVDIEVRSLSWAGRLSKVQVGMLGGRTQFEVKNGRVLVRRAVFDEEGVARDPFVDLGYGLVLLPAAKMLARVAQIEAWSRCEQHGEVNAGTFRMRFPDPVPSTWALMNARGQVVEAKEIDCKGRIDAVTQGQHVLVRLRAVRASGEELPMHEGLAAAIEGLFVDGPFALLVKSQSRRRQLVARLVELALCKEEKSRLWEEVANDVAFTSRAMHGDDAVRCLRHVLKVSRGLDERHLVCLPGSEENPWQVCSGAGGALAGTMAVFQRAFAAEDLLRSRDFVLEIDALRFFSNLSALAAAAEEFGVELRLDESTPRIEKLSLNFRVLGNGQIDWFELHPEARAGALTIPRSQWQSILLSGYLRVDKETVVAVDAESLSVLRELDELSGEETLRVPRLRLFDWLALRHRGVGCEMPSELATVVDSLQNLEAIPAHPLPKGLLADLREYQRHGFDWLCFLYRHRFGACLADDMGLGKTLQTVALLLAIKEGTLARQNPADPRPHLLVLPPTLLFNWQSEVAKFAPALKIHEYTGAERSRDFSGADIVMTTYELVRRDIEALANIPFDIAIFDEAQTIKNFAAARARSAAKLQAKFRLCLTGTPLENNVGEFHSIMEAAVPGIFGSRLEFLRKHEIGLPVLERARPFLLRRTKEKILAELPAKVESDAYFALSEAQRECYTRAVGAVRAEVLAAYEDRPAQQAGIVALAALMKLRQICIAPAMLSGELASDSPKIEFLVGQLGELAAEGHAALVFSQFIKALDLTAAALGAAGLPFIRMDGSTPMAQRKNLVKTFQSGEAPGIFLISMKTGGSGLNLTRASYVYHLDPWWNPAVENQASDRVHRIGQRSSVYVQRLLMRHTVEEKMMALKQRKQALFAAVLDAGTKSKEDGSTGLKASDFQFLIESEAGSL